MRTGISQAERTNRLVTVTVLNVAPTATITGAPATSPEGTVISLTSSVSDPGSADTFTYAWSVTKNGSPYGTGGTASTFSFTPNDNGTYVVTLVVTDDDGGLGTTSETVTATNVAPTATLGNDGPVDEGSPATVSFTGRADPSAVDTAAGFHYAFSCSNASLAAATYADSGTDAFTTCTYADNGTYTVRARIIDKDGGYTESSTDVVVDNVAPTVDAGSDATIDEGSAFTRSGSFSDPGADTWTATVNYGDGSGVQALTLAPDKSFSLSHVYADNGTYTVTVVVTDDDSDSGSDTIVVTVANVAPSVGPVTVTFDPVTHIATATASFTDPGAIDTHTATVVLNIGGTAEPAFVTEANGSGTVVGTIRIITGCFTTLTATVRVTDDDLGWNERAGTLTGTADAYAAAFQAPIKDNERNIAKYGNVVPIKVSLVSSCTGAAITTASLYVTLTPGTGGEFIDQDTFVAESVSSADTANLMRLNGGGYIYNLTTKGLTQGKDYAVRIRSGSSAGPIILQAVLQPKK